MPIPNRWFYKSRVIGKDKTRFNKYKIKTMYDGSDDLYGDVISQNGLDELGKPRNDPRIIPYRRWLRANYLDETPQILKLFTGEMKLVGIRPMGESGWKYYTDSIKEMAEKQKPGYLSILRGMDVSSFDEYLDEARVYLNEYEYDPVHTDVKHLLRILKNRVLKRNLSR